MRGLYKASYTIEATIVIPIILFALFQGMRIGMTLCDEVTKYSSYSEELQKLDGVTIFRTIEGLEELWGK